MLKKLKVIFQNWALKLEKRQETTSVIKVSEISSFFILLKVEEVSDIADIEVLMKKITALNIKYNAVIIESKKNIFPISKNKKLIIPDSLVSSDITIYPYSFLNWYGLPNEFIISELLHKYVNFDAVISFNETNNFTLDYLVNKLSGRCMIGVDNSDVIAYNIVLKDSGNERLSYEEFFEKLLDFIKSIEKN